VDNKTKNLIEDLIREGFADSKDEVESMLEDMGMDLDELYEEVYGEIV
jgi:hypothetical protein